MSAEPVVPRPVIVHFTEATTDNMYAPYQTHTVNHGPFIVPSTVADEIWPLDPPPLKDAPPYDLYYAHDRPNRVHLTNPHLYRFKRPEDRRGEYVFPPWDPAVPLPLCDEDVRDNGDPPRDRSLAPPRG